MTDRTAPDDRALAEAVSATGDERAFAALYDRHTPALYQLALRLCGGNAGEAEEIVHDAWVRAAERLASFEWRSALRTWLCGIVVNRARESWREAARAGASLDDVVLPVDDRQLTGVYDRVELERALATLAPGYRAVLVLHDVEGFTHEEIGGMQGIEPGTSKSQLSRARAEMRRALGTREGSRT